VSGRSPCRNRAALTLAALASALALSCGGGTEPGSGPDPRIRWTFTPSAPVYYGSPALSSDGGTAYIGTSTALLSAPSSAHALYALDVATGAVRWQYGLGAKQVRSSPAVGPDGSIAFVTTGGGAADLLYRLSSTGVRDWTVTIGPAALPVDVGLSAPAVASDGTIYVAGDALYAIRTDGTVKWKAFDWKPGDLRADEDLHNSPVIGADGTLYFVYHNIPLTALDPADGHVLWSLPLGVNDHVFASPAVAADGTIYVATSPCIVYAVSAAGVLRWTFNAADAGYSCTMRSSPAVAADGTLYLGTNNGSPASVLFALNPTGTVRWIFEPADLPPDVPSDHFDIYSSPAIGSDGTVYFGQEFGRIYALDAASGAIRWMVETSSGITWSSPALTAGGTLLISDLTTTVYAVTTDSRGFQAGAPWPRYRHDNASSGRAAP